MSFSPNIGAVYQGNGRCRFRVWAPFKNRVQVLVLTQSERLVDLEKEENGRGYWSAEIDDLRPGARYLIRLDENLERPDPASFDQPEGVHGPSRILDPAFQWHDDEWPGHDLREYIIYELHVGTFTPEGTFDAAVDRLDSLVDLGVTSIEIMPVSQFPGARNWGYDGVHLFAVQNSYGGPDGFRRFIDACHSRGLSVTLDVVYNHFGPEGNYLRDFGPYFTKKYNTPWGEALNFDDDYNDEVRNYFIQNALFWFDLYHIDSLRLDAVHAIFDRSAEPFLGQLETAARGYGEISGQRKYLIAESDLNDSRLIRPQEVWGCGLAAQWSDDFHHSLHSLLTGEREGYYRDFGSVADLATAMKEGYVYSGKYSQYRKRSHGNRSRDLPSEQFVVAAQNHDQVGNRMLGERLSALISFEAQKLAAAALLLSPFIPLLFMGEEYGEQAPFLYFVSHSDPELAEAVRRGRREEFKEFTWKEEPPDPMAEDTFSRSRLDWENRLQGRNKQLLDFYTELIRMRRENPALGVTDRDGMEVRGFEESKLLVMKRESGGQTLVALFNFGSSDNEIGSDDPGIGSDFRKILDSAAERWGGQGSVLPEILGDNKPLVLRGHSVAVFEKGQVLR
ncbi:MAG: malto-oligosyltrehalose trehalohydrolase [Syntrophobacteraceae bacterium]